MTDADLFFRIATFAIPLLFAITIHEAAHGYVARHFGDMTAASLGRITLNPFAHIDLIGTIVLPLLLLVATDGKFVFGYAKPVPVNFLKLRNPRHDMLLVALAGPLSNWVQALLWAVVLAVLLKVGIYERFFVVMAAAGVSVNLVLCMLNLFPLLPLDGGRILLSLLPHNAARVFAQLEPYGFIIVIALLFAGVISNYWITPLMDLGFKTLQAIIFSPLGLYVF